MTPAINLLKKLKTTHNVHEYQHDPLCESFGLEVVEKLFLPAKRVFKTLIISLDNNELAVAIVPVSFKLSLKSIAKVLNAKKVVMANKPDVERSTGYILGGVSPLGQKKRLKTVIDSSAKQFTSIYVSAGRRGLEVELSPTELAKLTNAVFADICL